MDLGTINREDYWGKCSTEAPAWQRWCVEQYKRVRRA